MQNRTQPRTVRSTVRWIGSFFFGSTLTYVQQYVPTLLRLYCYANVWYYHYSTHDPSIRYPILLTVPLHMHFAGVEWFLTHTWRLLRINNALIDRWEKKIQYSRWECHHPACHLKCLTAIFKSWKNQSSVENDVVKVLYSTRVPSRMHGFRESLHHCRLFFLEKFDPLHLHSTTVHDDDDKEEQERRTNWSGRKGDVLFCSSLLGLQGEKYVPHFLLPTCKIQGTVLQNS